MTYDPSNIFGKILRGEIPAHKVYEDATALVMMDVFPQSRGHVLVVPKAASRNLLDADPAALAEVIPLVQRVAKAVKTATGADGIRLAQFNEAPAGQTVFHLHSTSFRPMRASLRPRMVAARPMTQTSRHLPGKSLQRSSVFGCPSWSVPPRQS